MDLLILGITGKRGAGKDTVAEYLKNNYGFRILNFTKHVLSPILKKMGRDVTRKNLIDLALELRKKHGNDILVRKLTEHIKGDGKWIISGIRYPEEYHYLKSQFGERFKLLHVECDTKKRYERIKKRGTKGEGEMTFEEFMEIENAETEKVIDLTIELADLSITNNGTFEDLYRKLDVMMKKYFSMEKSASSFKQNS